MTSRRGFLKLLGLGPVVATGLGAAWLRVTGSGAAGLIAGSEPVHGVMRAATYTGEATTWVPLKEYSAAATFFGEEATLAGGGPDLGYRKIAITPEPEEQTMGEPLGIDDVLRDARRCAVDELRRTRGNALLALPSFVDALKRRDTLLDAVALEFLNDLSWRGDDPSAAIPDDGDGA